jgi:hypothetical protein
VRQVKWIDVDIEEPNENQLVLYISKKDVDSFRYDHRKSKYSYYDHEIRAGIYWREGLVEDGYWTPIIKIKYWSPAPRFEWEYQ